MADWTQLPSDLLHLISERLHSRLEVVRFRSVCSTWRSVVTSPGLHRLAPSFLFKPANSGNWSKWSGYFSTLSKRTVFLIGSPKSKIQIEPSTSWIIKIEHVPDPKRIRFLNPLSKSPYDSLPYKFPKSFNSLDFRVLELGEEYMIDSYERKVVLSCSDYNVHDFILLSISDYGDLAMFKSSDQRWTPIFQDTSPYYDDVVFYKENFYAVDIRGKILVVGLDSKISVVGEPIEDPSYDGRRKYLVESKGELFLIAMYWSLVRGRPRVFKLDEVSKEWIEVNNLNDRVLFIGNGCAFAATAEDLFLCRGNYIVFVNSIKPLLDVWDVRVVDLEDGSIRPLSKFPQLDKLFSPPYFGSSAKKGWKKQIAEKKKQITNKIAKLASAVTKGEQAAATRSWR